MGSMPNDDGWRMMSKDHTNIAEEQLKAARRTEQVEPALHNAVMRAVSDAQRAEAATGRPHNRLGWWPALGSAALASMVLAIWLGGGKPAIERTVPTPDGPEAQALADLLEDRLAQPLDALQALQQVTPLESELAALESDLAKMKPRWPWQAAQPPAG